MESVKFPTVVVTRLEWLIINNISKLWSTTNYTRKYIYKHPASRLQQRWTVPSDKVQNTAMIQSHRYDNIFSVLASHMMFVENHSFILVMNGSIYYTLFTLSPWRTTNPSLAKVATAVLSWKTRKYIFISVTTIFIQSVCVVWECVREILTSCMVTSLVELCFFSSSSIYKDDLGCIKVLV